MIYGLFVMLNVCKFRTNKTPSSCGWGFVCGGEVFRWTFEDWSVYAGMPYFGAVTAWKAGFG